LKITKLNIISLIYIFIFKMLVAIINAVPTILKGEEIDTLKKKKVLKFPFAQKYNTKNNDISLDDPELLSNTSFEEVKAISLKSLKNINKPVKNNSNTIQNNLIKRRINNRCKSFRGIHDRCRSFKRVHDRCRGFKGIYGRCRGYREGIQD